MDGRRNVGLDDDRDLAGRLAGCRDWQAVQEVRRRNLSARTRPSSRQDLDLLPIRSTRLLIDHRVDAADGNRVGAKCSANDRVVRPPPPRCPDQESQISNRPSSGRGNWPQSCHSVAPAAARMRSVTRYVYNGLLMQSAPDTAVAFKTGAIAILPALPPRKIVVPQCGRNAPALHRVSSWRHRAAARGSAATLRATNATTCDNNVFRWFAAPE